MDRFKALNVDNDESTITTITTITTEKIIENLGNEYSCVLLQAKQMNQNDVAIEMFQKILKSEEITQVDIDISSIKYCCYKNLAELYVLEASYQSALEHFLKAIEIDDNDVFFINKFGYIALKLQHFNLANTMFQRCLKLNPNHRPSYDGILDMLCKEENYIEAYGWSIYTHTKFPNYQRPIDVIIDVRDSLKYSPLMHNAFGPINSGNFKRSSQANCFPSASFIDMQEDNLIDLKKFKLKTLSFLAFGQMIKSIYSTSQITSYFTTKISINDICDIRDLKIEPFQISQGTKVYALESMVSPASHRTCNNPTPIKEIFQEFLPQYFSDDSEEEDGIIYCQSIVRAICQPTRYFAKLFNYIVDYQSFHNISMDILQQYIFSLKSKLIDISTIVYEWLNYMSKMSHVKFPIELQSLYIEIYEYSHVELNIWNEVSPSKAVEIFQMALLYIEFKIATNVQNSTEIPRFFDTFTMQHFYQVLFTKNLSSIDYTDARNELRLNLLHFQLAIQLMDFDLAMDLLCRIQEFFVKAPLLDVYLPNQFYCTTINPCIIDNEKYLIECLQQQRHHCQFNYYTVAILIKFQSQHFDCANLPSYYQLEMLIEHFWMIDPDQCLNYCEKGLHDAMVCWREMSKQNQHTILHQLPRHTQFLITYLGHLVNDKNLLMNSKNNVKKRRLIRSMTYLLEAQCDQRCIKHRIKLFNSNEYVRVLGAVVNCNVQTSQQITVETQLIACVAKWLILNNVSLPNSNDDDDSGSGGIFLMCAWNALNYSGYNDDINIRLLSHAIFGYPKIIEEQHIVCTCKPRQIDWNDVALLLSSLDIIKNGMTEFETKLLINDLLNTIPNGVQLELFNAIGQLKLFLDDTIDFPYKIINALKSSFPCDLKDIFHRLSNAIKMTKYGRYTHKELIIADLVLNTKRSSSWLKLFNMTIAQLNKIFNTFDLTKINIPDVEKLENCLDVCFNKCKILDHQNIDYMYCYGLHIYQMYNFFMKANDSLRDEFSIICISNFAVAAAIKSIAILTSWKKAKQILRSYLEVSKATIDTLPRSMCYFVLGKIAEKQNPTVIQLSLKYYLLAERELFDHQNDVDFQTIKLEINFRITTSIYKYITRTMTDVVSSVIDKSVHAQKLLQVLKRNKCQLFNDSELSSRPKYADNEIIDENSNQLNGDMELQQQLFNKIIRLCTIDFEWYLELNANYYKATYYLVQISFKQSNELKCRSLLLQLPRKSNEQDKKMSLFDIHRSRNLFKVKESMQLKAVHNLGSFNKYMEKCLNLLNKYLEITPNWYSQLVLVLQFNKVTRNRACLHLKLHQKQRLYTVIFMNFIRIANSHLRQFSQNTAKSKSFLNFLMKIYELYGILNSDYIESMHINAYSKLLIECYRLCANGAATKHMTGKSNNDEFQKALDFCAIESKKITKKPPTKANQADKNNPATSSNTDEMVNPKKLKSK